MLMRKLLDRRRGDRGARELGTAFAQKPTGADISASTPAAHQTASTVRAGRRLGPRAAILGQKLRCRA